MIFKPAQLGMAMLDPHELEADKKAWRKIGPCGVGKKAESCLIVRVFFIRFFNACFVTFPSSPFYLEKAVLAQFWKSLQYLL